MVEYHKQKTVRRPESPLERARRLTQERVDAGLLHPWVMGDTDQRDRFNDAQDRRAAFHVVSIDAPGRNAECK